MESTAPIKKPISLASRVYDAGMWIFLVVLIAGYGYYLYSTRPCAQPIYYKLGTFDPKFGISKADFLTDAQKAADLWNEQAGHIMLAYSATGTMPLNLIYDTRQQQANMGESIAQQEAALGTAKQRVASMESQYKAQQQKYEQDRAAGTDPETLNAEARSLNDLASQIQQEINVVNSKIDAVNANAKAFNANAGTDFEEGEFVEEHGSSRIDLYEFKTKLQLERLMAHEFGHSLGLEHDSGEESIMYPENIGTTFALSDADKAELTARCALTFQNLNPFRNKSLSSQ